MSTLNMTSETAEKMILEQENKRPKNSIAIRLHLKLIQDLQGKGFTRKTIYNFLKSQNIISCRYETFCNSLKSILASQNNREQISSSKQVQTVKKPAVTKTQFFEHNSSPSAELIASLTGETD